MNPNKYNQRDTILVIAPYPARSTTHTGGGIASYSKNTILAIKKANPTQKIVVLANIIDESEKRHNALTVHSFIESNIKAHINAKHIAE